MVLTKLSAGQGWRHRCREQACGPSGEGAGGTNCEIRTDIYTPACVKQRASGTQPQGTWSSAHYCVMP